MSVATAAREPRVLQLVDRLEVGGPARVVLMAAAGLRTRGVDARVAHLGLGDWRPWASELQAAGVPVLNLQLGSLVSPRVVLGLAWYLRRERIDVVHTHNRYANLVGSAAGLLARRAVVATIHNVVTTIHNEVEPDPGWAGAMRRRLDYLCVRRLCTAVICVSETQRNWYWRTAGVKAARVVTHLNGVDTDFFRPDPEARVRVRAQLGIPVGAPLFATVAMLRPVKGLHYLLEAAACVHRQAPQARFAIVGGGAERAKLEARTLALGLGAVVHLLGTRQDIPALLAAADVYVHPSLFEALPVSVLEAMAVGLPVVATRVGGVPEIVAHGRTGLLVPLARADELAAAMLRLLDPGPSAAMGAAGRAWVQAHASVPLWLENLQRVYRQVAGRSDVAG